MKTELEVFSGAFGELGIDGFDFGAVLEADTFFSIDALINTISIFEAEGVDISDTDFVQEWILSFMYFWGTNLRIRLRLYSRSWLIFYPFKDFR